MKLSHLINLKSEPIVTTSPNSRLSDVDERALSAAKAIARDKMSSITNRHRVIPFKTWEAIEQFAQITIPDTVKTMPLTHFTLVSYATGYVTSTLLRMEKARKEAEETLKKAIIKKDDLLPFNLKEPFREILRQRRAYTQIMNELWLNNPEGHRAMMIPMPMGSGKTVVAASVFRDLQDNNYYNQKTIGAYCIIYLTPKRVKIKVKRLLAAAGVKNIGTEVVVLSYNDLTSKKYSSHFSEVIVDHFGTKVKEYRWRLGVYPVLVVADETHLLKKPTVKRHKLAQALIGPDTRLLPMSGTPVVNPQDLRFFAINSRKKYLGNPITAQNFREVMWNVGQSDPAAPNAAAMERLALFFNQLIVNPPADPRKVKSTNRVITIPFPTPEAAQQYMIAQEKWREKCERLGKMPSERGEIMAATTIFRGAEERIKAPCLGQLMLDAHKDGFNPICGVAFVDPAKRIVEYLTRRGVSRENISLVWGGRKIIKPEECYSLHEWSRIFHKIEDDESDAFLDRKELAKFRRTSQFFAERWAVGETEEQQKDRNEWLSELELDAQSEEQQQTEIDRFQEGETQFLIFTLASGGCGLDADHQHNRNGNRPRKAFFSPTYYLEEVIQSLGRGYRESTISNIDQNIVFFTNTIVANHVAPKLAKKIGSFAKFAKVSFDLEADLINAVVAGKIGKTTLDITSSVVQAANDTAIIGESESSESIDEELLDEEDEEDE